MPSHVLLGSVFPATDPIPLPAPVWVFKVLLDVTLVLHFAALYALLGGLLAAVWLNARGHRAGDAGQIEASGAVAGWLPVVMTYVINLGVPPLLFAQVLYGRALYTSSVLVGAYWIAVIPLLIACYHLLYLMKARGEERRPWAGLGVLALLLAWAIARIYSANMSFMLDAGAWREAYRADQSGGSLLSGAAGWARWAYMLAAGVAGGGVLMAWLARGSARTEAAAGVLRDCAKWSVIGGTTIAVVAGVAAWFAQPGEVQAACSSANVWWVVAGAAWAVGAAGAFFAAPRLGTSWKTVAFLTACAALQTAGFVACRDMVRDASLARFGFDVWDRAVVVNWSVLGLFLVLFVAGLGVVGWLAMIGYRSEPLPAEGEGA